MTFIMSGTRYTLDADYDSETGASYTWTRRTNAEPPSCPACGDTLIREGRDFMIFPAPDAPAVLACLCGHELQETH